MNLEILIKKIKSVSTNIAIYTDHLKKHRKELSNKYKLDTNNANSRLDEIEKQVKKLESKKDKLYSKAKKTLKGIKNSID